MLQSNAGLPGILTENKNGFYLNRAKCEFKFSVVFPTQMRFSIKKNKKK